MGDLKGGIAGAQACFGPKTGEGSSYSPFKSPKLWIQPSRILFVPLHHPINIYTALQSTVTCPSLSQEIEKLVAHLNDEQLDQLEAILAKDLDTDSEFNMLLEGMFTQLG